MTASFPFVYFDKKPKKEYTIRINTKNKPIIVFMGTYPPRECGIATFNQDLLNSSKKYLGSSILCKVAAMNLFPIVSYIYPPEVEWEIDQNNKKEYVDLAKKLNDNPQIRGVIIQHEYGIYGGVDGENILSFIQNCQRPIIITLHTVLPNPSEKMREVTGKIIDRANTIVVLTQSSKQILATVYPQSINKVHVIPHGIHATKFTTTTKSKKKLKLSNKIVLATFGLLSRDKGIEYVIKALPKQVKIHPSLIYLVLGKTHPIVRRNEGESYRSELENLVLKLGLKKHVKFYDQYLTLAELLEFLKATDIYISSSINPNQTVSGTLSYALGTGRAVISTAFTQAKEIITTDIGRLVPIKNPKAYEDALTQLLSNKAELNQMHRQAYKKTRSMLWSNVAYNYSKLLSWNILPPVTINHLINMTDKFGLFQFAKLDRPDKKFGYTLDDNARALVVCCWLSAFKFENTKTLFNTYFQFIKKCQRPDGSFINYLDYEHKVTEQNRKEDLEDSTARAMWSLSEVMSLKVIPNNLRNEAKSMFIRAFPYANTLKHLRSSALIIKSYALALKSLDKKYQEQLTCMIRKYADNLIHCFNKSSLKSWQWFDDYLSYNNGIIPESLFIAGKTTNYQPYTDKAIITLNFLIQKTFSNASYLPIGHSHWYKNKEKRSHYDQQPEDPASMILALVTAYQITHDEAYRNLAIVCFSWFLGNNGLGLPLYNYDNGGCYDGLHPDRVNANQGAESQVSYLLSRLTLTKIRQYENS